MMENLSRCFCLCKGSDRDPPTTTPSSLDLESRPSLAFHSLIHPTNVCIAAPPLPLAVVRLPV